MSYYTLLKGKLDIIIDIWKPLQCLAYDQNEQSCLAFGASSFIPTSKICWYEIPNKDDNFIAKIFLNFDNRDDVCSYLLVAFVMAGEVAVNKTRIICR